MAAGGQTGTGAFSATTLGARYAETWLLHHTETGVRSLGLSPFQLMQGTLFWQTSPDGQVAKLRLITQTIPRRSNRVADE
jgi:hypothetical protein